MTISSVAFQRKIASLTIPCESVTVIPSSNIFATDISILPGTCTEPCTLTINVTYTNNGTLSGNFTPTILVDGNPITLPIDALNPNETKSEVFSVINIKKGLHTVCVEPIGLTTCQTIDIKPQVVAAGLPIILGAGLLFGLIFKKRKECSDYKTIEECHKNECQWKKKKCIPLSSEDKYLIQKLREKGAVGVPICKGEECRIGPWIAVARKGKEPIIIHDP